MMKNLGQMMKQAQQVQERMQAMQAELERAEMTGSAGGGMVRLVVSGKGELRKVSIDKALLVPDDVEVLEDLLVAAFNDARAKVDAYAAEQMSKVTGGLQLPPGFKLPF
jgi:DNA-binding YbaB/EbfC family protein